MTEDMKQLMDYRVFTEEQKALGTSALETAARWWDHLAEVEMDKPKWDRFSEKSGCEFRAETYRRTAEALRIQERTGVAVCSCCHKPIGTDQCKYSRRNYA